MNHRNHVQIALVELPELKLLDPNGNNLLPPRKREPLISKQVLMAGLQAAGFTIHLVNMQDSEYEEEFDQISWRGIPLRKLYTGWNLARIDPADFDIWGLTVNFTLHREIACMVIQRLAASGKPVIVGGSDAVAEPAIYFQAGASAIVKDKSGAANTAIFDYFIQQNATQERPTGVLFPDGKINTGYHQLMSPNDWPLPSLETARLCMGDESWMKPYPESYLPVGSVFPDIGCDRKCTFCQTPTYRLGYQSMTPERTLEWVKVQKDAGAGSVMFVSDQFLGRTLWPGGRDEILEIMRGVRELEMPIIWPNGLELRKTTLGRGFNRQNADLSPDEELIDALWGWDGVKGAYGAYIPAERPIEGTGAYAKLLPWREHVTLLKRIVQSGIPIISYGVIIGFPTDTHESLLRLEEALMEVYAEVKSVNPNIQFMLTPFVISPIPSTPQAAEIRESGLLVFDDPIIYSGFWTASVNTNHLSYAELSDWQYRLTSIGDQEKYTGVSVDTIQHYAKQMLA